MRRATDRAATLTQQLLAFSRQQVLKSEVLDLNAIVENLAQLLRRIIGENIELVLELEPASPRIHADAGQMEQVLMNLAVNARDAMPKGGLLRIETRGDPAGLKFVEILVTDTGDGMDGATLEHLFEPFFTTKERGKGTGLGLATVYGIISQSRGAIEVSSGPGQGTTLSSGCPPPRSPFRVTTTRMRPRKPRPRFRPFCW